jgi:hypothetical protein
VETGELFNWNDPGGIYLYALARTTGNAGPESFAAGTAVPYYTNDPAAGHAPADIYDALDLQEGCKRLHRGAVFHGFWAKPSTIGGLAAIVVKAVPTTTAPLFHHLPDLLGMPDPRIPEGRAFHLPDVQVGAGGASAGTNIGIGKGTRRGARGGGINGGIQRSCEPLRKSRRI